MKATADGIEKVYVGALVGCIEIEYRAEDAAWFHTLQAYFTTSGGYLAGSMI
jgi:hypothetical protein